MGTAGHPHGRPSERTRLVGLFAPQREQRTRPPTATSPVSPSDIRRASSRCCRTCRTAPRATPRTPATRWCPSIRTAAEAGADLKYLLTSNITLDATINPDFGQVDLDPAVINLTAFETYFPEKRPFFISGSGAFDFGGFNCFFCSNVSSLQSVLLAPHRPLPAARGLLLATSPRTPTFPNNTTILGAAKITGRTETGYTVGVLDAVTDEENGSYLVAPDSARHTVPMEPLSNYLVARVKQDLGDGATEIGGIVTSTVRDLDSPMLADSLHRHAEAAGGDFITTWDHRHYSLMGSAALSDVAGTPAIDPADRGVERALLPASGSPARSGDGLFANGLRFGGHVAPGLRRLPAARPRTTATGSGRRRPISGARDSRSTISSFMGRSDYIWNNANIVRQWTVPGAWYRSLFAIVGGQTQHNFSGDRTDLQGQVSLIGQLPQFLAVQPLLHLSPDHHGRRPDAGRPGRQATTDTRMPLPACRTDPRRALVVQANTEAAVGLNEPSQQITTQLVVLVKPASSVSFSLGPTLVLLAARRTVRHRDHRPERAAVLRDAVRVLEHRPEHAVDGYAVEHRVHTDAHARPLRAAAPRERTLLRVRAVRPSAPVAQERLRPDVGSIKALDQRQRILHRSRRRDGKRDRLPREPQPGFRHPQPGFQHPLAARQRGAAMGVPPGSDASISCGSRCDSTTRRSAISQFSRDQSLLLRAPADNVFLVKVNYWLPL